MQIASYRATERGIRNRMAEQLAEERNQRMVAQRALWQAQQERIEERRRQEKEAELRRLALQAEMRALGRPMPIAYHIIENRAIRVFKINRHELRGEGRTQQIVLARQFIMYWSARLSGLSLPKIGRLMGGKDHSTILHGRDTYPKKRAKMGRYLRSVR